MEEITPPLSEPVRFAMIVTFSMSSRLGYLVGESGIKNPLTSRLRYGSQASARKQYFKKEV